MPVLQKRSLRASALAALVACAFATPAVADPSSGGSHFFGGAHAAQSLRAPVVGKTANLERVSGTVRVQRRGTRRFVALRAPIQVRIGSTVDATKGVVRVTAATGAPSAATMSGDFSRGQFLLAQAARRIAPAEMRLAGGDFRRCPGAGRSATGAARRSVRRLFGDSQGRFRTRGRFGVAAVRGTRWLTEDRCDGTAFSVEQGSITVTDLVRLRTVVIEAGKSYLAPAGSTRSATRTVPLSASSSDWRNTGVTLERGESAAVLVAGDGSTGGGEGNPDGNGFFCTSTGFGPGPAGPEVPVGRVAGRLVATRGGSPRSRAPFAVGSGTTVRGPGRLELVYNDCADAYFNNSGSFLADIAYPR